MATVTQPKIDAILAALGQCNGFEEFQEKLSQMDLNDGDNTLLQLLQAGFVTNFERGLDGDAHA